MGIGCGEALRAGVTAPGSACLAALSQMGLRRLIVQIAAITTSIPRAAPITALNVERGMQHFLQRGENIV
jgi:hypothetical protein